MIPLLAALVSDAGGDEDEGILRRIAAGDADALGRLYDRYGRVLFGLLYRMLPSPESAEEVLQDAFHSVWVHAGSYRAERGKVRTWLLAVARNAAIDWRRTRGRRAAGERPLEEAEARSEPRGVEDLVEASLRSERVRDALAGLPAEQREAIVLAFFRGLTHSEIAERTGAPLGTVKSRVRLAMERLRRSLVEEASP